MREKQVYDEVFARIYIYLRRIILVDKRTVKVDRGQDYDRQFI